MQGGVRCSAGKMHETALEHLRSARKGTDYSAFGEQFSSSHPNTQPKIIFKVVKHCQGQLRLQVEEAMAIKEHKPTLNRRTEDLGTGFLL